MTCPFCAISNEKTRIVTEKKHVIVVLSDPRLMPGHLLVVPKRHVERISELDDEERTELFATAVEFQERILERIAKGCDIRQHYRPFQKQDNLKVDHLHVHLQPRELRDELYQKCQLFEKSIFKGLPKDEEERFAALLR